MERLTRPANRQKDPPCTHTRVAKIFASAQASAASHSRNCVALSQLHESDCRRKCSGADPEEDNFTALFLEMLSRVLATKKGYVFGDRIVKFVAVYIAHINKSARSFAHAFTLDVLQWLKPGCSAKNKSVRYRVVHVITEIVAHLPTGINKCDIATKVWQEMKERAEDVETSIRMLVLVLLCSLCDDFQRQGDHNTLANIEVVVHYSLASDPSADIRQALIQLL
ncbi:hypothetical protein PUNSTDRAFT_134553 [Punctularia strigosozonata HHB-11173 SS5]|uniref:uncharacterized protein n=1 Tax=Punctularia strigosozonata (strain HHB-11173) TaxID=741275 RepID=UPI0004417DAF|nr:uncharacterized protein PUNSTDRAFT_134553 [Punctularia strigosozonata HHB-11173 SS5]EIN08156.1 hypothetical protein PUNSTDRAFT_134553 [Punctularia strigosozonata HHB-11173 SS5]